MLCYLHPLKGLGLMHAAFIFMILIYTSLIRRLVLYFGFVSTNNSLVRLSVWSRPCCSTDAVDYWLQPLSIYGIMAWGPNYPITNACSNLLFEKLAFTYLLKTIILLYF